MKSHTCNVAVSHIHVAGGAGDADDSAAALADGRHVASVDLHVLLLLLHEHGLVGLGHDSLGLLLGLAEGLRQGRRLLDEVVLLVKGLAEGLAEGLTKALAKALAKALGQPRRVEARHGPRGHVADERGDGGDLVRRGGAAAMLAVGGVVEDKQAAGLDLRQA